MQLPKFLHLLRTAIFIEAFSISPVLAIDFSKWDYVKRFKEAISEARIAIEFYPREALAHETMGNENPMRNLPNFFQNLK